MCPHRKKAHRNVVVAWNMDLNIIPFLHPIDFQLFFKLFLSFSMTGCSLLTKGDSVDVDLTFHALLYSV